MQRSEALIINRVHVRAVFEQIPHNFDLPASASHVKGRTFEKSLRLIHELAKLNKPAHLVRSPRADALHKALIVL